MDDNQVVAIIAAVLMGTDEVARQVCQARPEYTGDWDSMDTESAVRKARDILGAASLRCRLWCADRTGGIGNPLRTDRERSRQVDVWKDDTSSEVLRYTGVCDECAAEHENVRRELLAGRVRASPSGGE
jgi:hypothetical protein